jgi:hypothetical protein
MHPFKKVNTLYYHPLPTLGPFIFPRTWKPLLPDGSKEFNVLKNHQISESYTQKISIESFHMPLQHLDGEKNKKNTQQGWCHTMALPFTLKGYV